MLKFAYFLRSTFFTNSKIIQNHYQVLGLKHEATQKQIKASFYQLAKRHHPDISKDPNSNTIFIKITNAYEVLSDSQLRKQYDSQFINTNNHKQNQQRYSQKRTKSKFEKDQSQYEPYTNFDPYFGRNKHHFKPKKGQNISVGISITLKQSVLGIKKLLTFQRITYCPQCKPKVFDSCYTCGGKGAIFNRKERNKQKCQSCNGKGFLNDCTKCFGTSQIKQKIQYQIFIPRNTHDKTILRVQSHGHHGFRHDNGDLIVTVNVEQTQKMRVDGNNIHSQHELNYITAVFGGKISVQTIQGKSQVTINPGTQSGQTLRLFNKGLISPFSKRKGDHIITFKIKVNQPKTHKQRELFQFLEQIDQSKVSE